MDFVGDCEECQDLAAEYESATMDWFRAQGQLRVAQFSHEEESSNRISAELDAIVARREALRQAVESHKLKMHVQVAAAAGRWY